MAPSRWRILEGKVVAITGGTTGIGRAIALEYLRQGCNVAMNPLGLERDEKHKLSLVAEAAALKAEKVEGETTSKAGDLLEVVGDVTKARQAQYWLRRRWRDGESWIYSWLMLKFRAGRFLTLFRVHLRKDMANRTVDWTTSFIDRTCPRRWRIADALPPTKAGVLSLMQSMAISLGKDNLRCNTILPETTKTQLSEDDMKNDVKRKYLEARIPMGRVADTSDIAGPAVFLASEHLSPYCNGPQLLSDGGMFVNLQ
ncbi:hypothetical protein MBM_02654 [Drepanopeziza brunnea f. sp. 'multigermtubi' MB_m1]|uniref:Uncharacterized protein n=1 Tax=Marssonina brunnea f. sp. multigermtubi (strain MB_m1) TaxID=1072389 RepID=K1X315_MARBU|nr:uncharacterized protein MBM_02654 [Drepanopeziza brunnea f. sp. 'multigermtubi' MB_m1]EKD19417.1 hypothetical protein MBM_02654 [Drepanopeziza brunnea f. sp. 'multigermtubi' MB_m1]